MFGPQKGCEHAKHAWGEGSCTCFLWE